jgi:hypothetical protein
MSQGCYYFYSIYFLKSELKQQGKRKKYNGTNEKGSIQIIPIFGWLILHLKRQKIYMRRLLNMTSSLENTVSFLKM